MAEIGLNALRPLTVNAAWGRIHDSNDPRRPDSHGKVRAALVQDLEIGVMGGDVVLDGSEG